MRLLQNTTQIYNENTRTLGTAKDILMLQLTPIALSGSQLVVSGPKVQLDKFE